MIPGSIVSDKMFKNFNKPSARYNRPPEESVIDPLWQGCDAEQLPKQMSKQQVLNNLDFSIEGEGYKRFKVIGHISDTFNVIIEEAIHTLKCIIMTATFAKICMNFYVV